MTKQIIRLGFVGMAMLTAFTSCSDEQQFTNVNTDAKRTDVQQISPEMAKVRDYVPLYACVAHRGSTYWLLRRLRQPGVGPAIWAPTTWRATSR